MMNASTDSAPVKAQVLAQVNVDGGGQATSGVASNNLPYLDQAPEAVVLERLIKQRLQLEAEQQQLLTQLHSQQLVQDNRPAEQFLKDSQQPGQDERNQEQVLLNSSLTALSERVQRYNQRPRFTSNLRCKLSYPCSTTGCLPSSISLCPQSRAFLQKVAKV